MARKMILVPSEMMQKQTEKVITDLDSEMQEILSKDMDDREKWKLYQQTLHRFTHHTTAARQPVPLEIIESRDLSLTTVPLRYRGKAQKLLTQLSRSDAVRWGENGEVQIRGQPIQGSNILDLITEVVKPTKSRKQVAGYEKFTTILNELTPIAQTPKRRIQRWTPYRRTK